LSELFPRGRVAVHPVVRVGRIFRN
jgi:hypothetical protein